jgi:hypothetical protein
MRAKLDMTGTLFSVYMPIIYQARRASRRSAGGIDRDRCGIETISVFRYAQGKLAFGAGEPVTRRPWRAATVNPLAPMAADRYWLLISNRPPELGTVGLRFISMP